jgi:hypothetical protein
LVYGKLIAFGYFILGGFLPYIIKAIKPRKIRGF